MDDSNGIREVRRDMYSCIKLIAEHTLQDVGQLMNCAIFLEYATYKLPDGSVYKIDENGQVIEVKVSIDD